MKLTVVFILIFRHLEFIMGIFTYHGIVIKDYENNIVKEVEISKLEYFIRNEEYWYKECYWSTKNPIAPTEIGLPKPDGGNYYHVINTSELN